MGKVHKLTKDEQAKLAQVGEVITMLQGWSNLLGYFKALAENDRQEYTDKVIRPRLGLKPSDDDKPDIQINVVKAELVEL